MARTSCSSAGCFPCFKVLPGFVVVNMELMMMLMFVMVLLLLQPSVAFNVDLETAIIHKGKGGSMFGYAVAQHVDQSTNWLLIGAPKAGTSQIGVTEGGAVFRCKTDLTNSCQEVPFDQSGNNVVFDSKLRKYRSIEEKSHQWFGSTIESSVENGVIVACAPRYVYFSKDLNKREPVGVCWVSKTSTTEYTKYSPCAQGELGFHRQGFCQAGFSAALSQDGKRLMITAPGSWYWQGQLFNFEASEGDKIKSSTSEKNATFDDRYMGYSSAIGKFDDDDKDDYVVGIPKGDLYLGKIEMYDQNMTLIGNLSGEQIGSYFGAALAVTDLNGDRLDDIIVGAPLYTDFELDNNYDTGRVYIFYQTNSRTFRMQKKDILDGKSSQSRFGMALSGIGNINYDGYNDLCVGAPYAGENKKGAIYIYHGSKKGIITEASQIIYAEDLKSPLSAFGISISGGIDQDGNSYPDMLVGAYESDKAVFLRTRAVVHVYASLKLEPQNVDLDIRSCSLVDGTLVTCLNIYSCLKYNGVGVPDELYFELSWTLDVKESNTSTQEQRAYYINTPTTFTEKKTFKIEKEDTFCTSSFAYIKNDIYDKLSPIRASLDFNLIEDEYTGSRSKRELRPILDAYTPTSTSFTMHILKNCGLDNICIPDLSVTYIRVDTEHIIGSKDELEVLIIVKNVAEDSFNTKLWIQLPPGVDYGSFSGEPTRIPIGCGLLEKDDTIVVCDMGNPMIRSESQFTMNFQPTDSNDTQDTLVFTLFVNSSNTERTETYKDNEVVLDIPVKAETKIELYGKANPDSIIFNTTDASGTDRGRIVKHIFQLENDGRSAINETELQIKWPGHDEEGNSALILEGPLEIDGNGKCSILIITPENASTFGYTSDNLVDIDLASRSGKKKRDTNMEKIACRTTHQYCTIIQCLVGYMARYKHFILTVKSRINVRDFIKRRKDTKMYHLVSVAHAKVRSVPYDFKSVDESSFPVKRLELTTKVNTYHLRPSGKEVDNWIIIVAIVVGILLLLLVILLLWCCGFFKRKKPVEEGYFVVNGKTDIDNKYVD